MTPRTSPDSRSQEYSFLLLTLASFVFFALMPWVQARAGWKGLGMVFVGVTVYFACIGLVLVGFGLWWRRAMLVVAGLGVWFPLLLCWLDMQEVEWIGGHTTTLTLLVVDATTCQPIAEALVRVCADEDSQTASAGTTDADGRVLLTHEFTAVGTDRLFRKTGVIYLWRETLQVEAKGYYRLRVPLEKYTGPVWDLYGPPLPPVEVRLQKK